MRLVHVPPAAADVDIAYAVKPLWESYLAFIEQAQSDGAWLEEKPACEPSRTSLLHPDAAACWGCLPTAACRQACCHGEQWGHSRVLTCIPRPNAAANTGHFVLVPTPASLAFAEAWNASAAPMMEEGLTDQKALPALESDAYLRCNTLCRCFRAAYNVGPCCASAGLPACAHHLSAFLILQQRCC